MQTRRTKRCAAASHLLLRVLLVMLIRAFQVAGAKPLTLAATTALPRRPRAWLLFQWPRMNGGGAAALCGGERRVEGQGPPS